MTKHKFAFSWPLWIFFTWGLRVSILYYILTTFNTSLNKLDGKLQIQRTKELQRRTTINHVVGRSIALSLERMRFENHRYFPSSSLCATIFLRLCRSLQMSSRSTWSPGVMPSEPNLLSTKFKYSRKAMPFQVPISFATGSTILLKGKLFAIATQPR